MTSETRTSRKRQEPLSSAQCFYLIGLFEEDQGILLSKENTADTNKKKKAKWTEIAAKFSNRYPECKRQATDLKKKWENMVTTAKKWHAAKKRTRTMTGGGAPLPDPPEYIQHVAELYKDSANFSGIEGGTESEGVVDPIHKPSEETPGVSASPEEESEVAEIPSEEVEVTRVPEPNFRKSHTGTMKDQGRMKKRSNERILEELHMEVMESEKEKLELEKEKLKLEIDILRLKRAKCEVEAEEAIDRRKRRKEVTTEEEDIITTDEGKNYRLLY